MVGRFSTDYGFVSATDLSSIELPAELRAGVTNPARLGISEPALVTAGPQKAIQAFLTHLLTKVGSARNPDLGCTFLRRLQTAPPRNTTELRNLYNSEVAGVIEQVNVWAFSNDEIISSAPLIEATVAVGSIAMTIQINTAAGASVTYLVPVEGV